MTRWAPPVTVAVAVAAWAVGARFVVVLDVITPVPSVAFWLATLASSAIGFLVWRTNP